MADFVEHQLPNEGRLKINRDRLQCFPSSAGMMHDECKVRIGVTPFHWRPKVREIPTNAILHDSVYERLNLDSVRTFSGYERYLPPSLEKHAEAKIFFQTK
jgi:hypothetical protein